MRSRVNGGFRAALPPTALSATALAATLLLTGCGWDPADPGSTLEHVSSGGVLRAGASPSGDLVVVDGTVVTGAEAALVEDFADSLGAKVEWRPGGEEELVAAMERGELDLIVGGLSEKSPWKGMVALTRPYAETVEHGQKVAHVMAVPLGENAMLSRLERHLDAVAP